MAFETKEEVFEDVICQEKPACPYCGKEMCLWEVPDISIDDGLGWGTPYLFICFNDECSLYKGGWEDIKENYGRSASYRCICYPDSRKCDCMSVWGAQGGHGQIIDDKVLEERKNLEENIRKGMEELAEYRTSVNSAGVLEILLNASRPIRVRSHAAEILAEAGTLDAIDSLRNSKFANSTLQKKVDTAADRIHERHFTRECPYCAEIIKQQAKVCKHCGKEVAGH